MCGDSGSRTSLVPQWGLPGTSVPPPGLPPQGSGTQAALARLRNPGGLGGARGPGRLWPGSGTRVASAGLRQPRPGLDSLRYLAASSI